MFITIQGFTGGSAVKEPPAMGEMQDTRPWAEKVPWRRAWQCTPILPPEESQGQRRLVGYSSWGPKESGMTKVTQCACILIPNAPSVYGQSV